MVFGLMTRFFFFWSGLNWTLHDFYPLKTHSWHNPGLSWSCARLGSNDGGLRCSHTQEDTTKIPLLAIIQTGSRLLFLGIIKKKINPYVAVLPIRLPVSCRVAVEQPVLLSPVGAAVSTLCRNSCDLLPAPEVHLQPSIPVGVQRRPASISL